MLCKYVKEAKSYIKEKKIYQYYFIKRITCKKAKYISTILDRRKWRRSRNPGRRVKDVKNVINQSN